MKGHCGGDEGSGCHPDTELIAVLHQADRAETQVALLADHAVGLESIKEGVQAGPHGHFDEAERDVCERSGHACFCRKQQGLIGREEDAAEQPGHAPGDGKIGGGAEANPFIARLVQGSEQWDEAPEGYGKVDQARTRVAKF